MPIIREPKSSVALSHLDLRRKIYQAIPMLGVPALLRISTLIESFKPVPETPMNKQVAGNHYKSEFIQPGELAEINNLSAWQFSIYKYITRFRKKKGAEDLKKAIHCVEHLLWSEYGVCDEWVSGSGVKTDSSNSNKKTAYQISYQLMSGGEFAPKNYEYFRCSYNAEKRQSELNNDSGVFNVGLLIFDYQLSEGEQYHWQDGKREGDLQVKANDTAEHYHYEKNLQQKIEILKKSLTACIDEADDHCSPGSSVTQDQFKTVYEQLDALI